jgi:hypothetical protein
MVATLDSIFQKSNLAESKKAAKMLFGKLLISLRKSNHIKLYSMLESVGDMDIVDGVLKLTLADRTTYEMIDNKDDYAVLNKEVDTLRPGTIVELACNGRRAFDPYQFETRLFNEFGKILTIKRK